MKSLFGENMATRFRDSATDLVLLGGTADFLACRCSYLIRHPDGETGHDARVPVEAHEFHGAFVAALTEALINVEWKKIPEWGAPWQFLETKKDAVGMRFVWLGEDIPSNRGWDFLKAVGAKIEIKNVGARREISLLFEAEDLVPAQEDFLEARKRSRLR